MSVAITQEDDPQSISRFPGFAEILLPVLCKRRQLVEDCCAFRSVVTRKKGSPGRVASRQLEIEWQALRSFVAEVFDHLRECVVFERLVYLVPISATSGRTTY